MATGKDPHPKKRRLRPSASKERKRLRELGPAKQKPSNRTKNRNPNVPSHKDATAALQGKWARERKRAKETILLSLETMNSRTHASLVAGITMTTFNKWCKDDPDFLKAVEKAESKPIESAVKTLLLCATKAAKDPRYQTSLIFLLKCKGGFDDGNNAKARGAVDASETARSIREALKQARISIGVNNGNSQPTDPDSNVTPQ
jgi:hypothetical protein